MQWRAHDGNLPRAYLEGLKISHLPSLAILGTLMQLRHCAFTGEQKRPEAHVQDKFRLCSSVDSLCRVRF